MSNSAVPTTIVVFGATGDLFRRKLAQALFDLGRRGLLSTVFKVVGFSRRPWNDNDFRQFVRETLAINDGNESVLPQFLSNVFYIKGDIDDAKSYQEVAELLGRLDKEAGVCMNKLFYLAVPPSLYRVIFKNISNSGLSIRCVPDPSGNSVGWTRILVEKPFGNDLVEAKALDKLLGNLFEEKQIFRIDHYLAKETLQNILTFRFSNGLFEPLWNSRFIEKVELRLYERGTVGSRGASYDPVGALKDVGQNHLLQMLALVAMDNPGKLEAEAIREKRRLVLKKAELFSSDIKKSAVRGQYEGYQNEQGVLPESKTETYFKIKLKIASPRWRGVPFYLESGKCLSESKTEIAVHFKETTACLCPVGHKKGHQNVITFSIQPKEAISIIFWSKHPGFDFGLEPKTLSFSPEESQGFGDFSNSYERVLFDAIKGDQTLFLSTAEVNEQWKIITPIIKAWREEAPDIVPIKYKKGAMPEVDL